MFKKRENSNSRGSKGVGSINELNDQMNQNLRAAKEKTELLEKMNNKGEELAMESTNFVAMAKLLNKGGKK
jgi:hypothetical protein